MNTAAAFLALTAALAWLNQRFLRLPSAIGLTAAALLMSAAMIGLDAFGIFPRLQEQERSLLQSVDFTRVLMQGMLSVLLFAGALRVDTRRLRAFAPQVAVLAGAGTLLCTLVVSLLLYWSLPLVGLDLPLLQCLLFGALISPTDPVAVLGILRSAGVPKSLEIVITGESLFNDGVGVVVFSLLLSVAERHSVPGAGEVGVEVLREAGGGLVFGLALGYLTYRLLRGIDQYEVEVMVTVAAVFGGYALAQQIGVSGPLAMVVSGLIVGSLARRHGMSDVTREYVDHFWELLDHLFNAVLFLLIGLEIAVVSFESSLLLGALLAIAATLIGRWLTVGLPLRLIGSRSGLPQGAAPVLTWGALRGGIAVALALSLPRDDSRDALITLTYGVVVFSILVQGLTIGRLARRVTGGAA